MGVGGGGGGANDFFGSHRGRLLHFESTRCYFFAILLFMGKLQNIIKTGTKSKLGGRGGHSFLFS